MKADVLSVYSEMDVSSAVVRSLKKGEALLLDFEIGSASGAWCSVRLPNQTARLGYVQCDGLDTFDLNRRAAPQSSLSPTAPGSAAPGALPASRRPAIRLAAPSARATSEYDRVAALVVHEDEIDVVQMQALDGAARAGSVAAMDRAALAHVAAGNFEIARNSVDEAIDQYQAALEFGTKQPQILVAALVNLSYAHLRRSEYSAALENLDRARLLAPHSVAVAQLSGWAYYSLNRLEDAVAQWRMAQRLQPSAEIAQLLDRAERDRAAESKFHEGETSHFVVHYEGGASPELADAILQTLESQFRDIQSLLHYTPPEPIGVVLYTNQQFRDVTRAPSWSGALNDGRIRVPVQGLTSVTDKLSRVLKHELTHSFVRQMTENRCPEWLNEGLAQWVEGRRSGDMASLLVSAYEQKKYIPLSRLEGSWMSFPTPVAVYAYAWSLAAVEAIIANSGIGGIQRLFAGLLDASSVQAALGPALESNYDDLELETAQYLRRTYLH